MNRKLEPCALCGEEPSGEGPAGHGTGVFYCGNDKCVASQCIGWLQPRDWNRLQSAISARVGKVLMRGRYCKEFDPMRLCPETDTPCGKQCRRVEVREVKEGKG